MIRRLAPKDLGGRLWRNLGRLPASVTVPRGSKSVKSRGVLLSANNPTVSVRPGNFSPHDLQTNQLMSSLSYRIEWIYPDLRSANLTRSSIDERNLLSCNPELLADAKSYDISGPTNLSRRKRLGDCPHPQS